MNRNEIDKTWIVNLIKDFISNSPYNQLQNATGEKAWDEPLIGFSAGNDPLYDEFKNHIGDFYWTPVELFSQTFPETSAPAEELTIISWVLPHIAQTKQDNQQETRLPSERWARARGVGDKANTMLREQVISSLASKGYKSLAPDLSPFKRNGVSERYGRSSSWSERHAAFASGLGTFGLCDGLITPVGKAVRCGSVIAHIKVPPTERPYQDHHAYCLHFARGTCGKCIERCPVEAISREKGHDKEKCHVYLRNVTEDYIKSQFGIEAHACGLCQTGVPCESRIPLKS
jgi:epoxyqueuosine reductase QueG